ncbi:hypothetical protein [Microvirga sp. KLBC 81]|nr:hypothetical protein [Microvirga sp. KLBC 81]
MSDWMFNRVAWLMALRRPQSSQHLALPSGSACEKLRGLLGG